MNDRRQTIVAVAQTAGAAATLEQNVGTHARLASRAAGLGARLVIFPELSLSGYDLRLTAADAVDLSDRRLGPLQSIADEHEIVLMAGAPITSAAGLQIGTITVAPRVGMTTYFKRFLGDSERSTFVPGPGGDPLTLDGQLVASAICADITHPEHARDAAAAGATIYAAGCLLGQDGYAADTALLGGYAREHRMVVMMANYAAPVRDWEPAGGSAIWSADGTLLACAPEHGEALVIGTGSTSGWRAAVVRP